jgi:hypothetical protein
MNAISKVSADSQYLPSTLDKAEQLLALAESPEEIKSVMAMMAAAVAFANVEYKGQHDIIQRAKALQLQAERKLGELLAAMPKAKGGEQYKTTGTKSVPVVATTLANIGIDKKTSARAQKLAALPDDVFDQVTAGKVSVAKAIAKPDKAKGKTTPPPKSLYSNPKASPEREITEEEVAAFGDADFVQLYEDSLSEIAVLNKRIDRYELDDKNAEIARLNTYIDRINGLHDATKNELRDALDIGKRNVNTLAKIRKALNVERDQDILSALKKAA